MSVLRSILVILLMVHSLPAIAVIETYRFNSQVDEKRYQQFVEELRCPKCQNQNLSGSNSPIAKDLRRELYRMISDGQSDQEITNFMVERYGNFILYRPPLDKKTIVLWASPLILLIFAGAFLFALRRSAANVQQEMTAADKERLEQLLSKYG